MAARPLRYEHGVRVGDALSSAALACSDDVRRRLGGAGAQLVTFASPSDCAECDRHLLGLSALPEAAPAGVEHLFIAYAPAAQRAHALRAVRARTRQPICLDDGALWQTYGITHTPFTALLVGGQVVFLDDAPLDSDEQRAGFQRALEAARAAGRPGAPVHVRATAPYAR